jgi:branched-chain amino acid transport system permease protein
MPARLKGLRAARRALLVAAPAAALLALPLVTGPYLVHVFTITLYYVILAASWNLLAGYTGQFSLAQQSFAAVGAYTSGLLATRLAAPLYLSIPCGAVAAAGLGWVLGRMVLRLRAIYLAIATWAFAETIHILLTAAYQITRGELGLSVPALYGSLRPVPYYETFLALAAASLFLMYLMVRSPIGFFMRAIRDDELRAQSMGIDTTRVKVLVFTVSSAFAGLAGAFYAHYTIVLSPQMADFSEMAKLIIMVVVGGLGSFAGPLIGAPPVQIALTYLAKYGEWDMVIFALVVIALMRTTTGGIVQFGGRAWARLTRRRGAG